MIMNENPIIPRTLYKYASPVGAIAILQSQNIRYTHPRDFNDPYDVRKHYEMDFQITSVIEQLTNDLCNAAINGNGHPLVSMLYLDDSFPKNHPNKFREMAKAAITKEAESFDSHLKDIDNHWYQKRLRDLRITCFSEEGNNELMWSHYADKHRGVVLGFGTDKHPDRWNFFRKVLYKDHPVNGLDNAGWIEVAKGNETPPSPLDGLDYMYFTKHSRWSYENEWRAIRYEAAVGDDPVDVPYLVDELSTITFGINCSTETQEAVLHILSEKGMDPAAFQAEVRGNDLTCRLVPHTQR